MIVQDIYIKEHDWLLHAYFAVDAYYTDEIMERLWEMGCDSEHAERAYENLASGELNSGLCYSNYERRETVLVIAITSSADEFLNSLLHELTHFQSHVQYALSLDKTGEDVAYLVGDVVMLMYPKIKHLLCDCCRTKNDYDYE
jgi:hypothetical protein